MANLKTPAALLAAFGAGALSQHFWLDRQHGPRRRHTARDRVLSKARHGSRDAMRRAHYLEGVAEGVAHKAAHTVPGASAHKEPLDDISLAQKVESVAFRAAGVSKAHVSVNVENGVVYLRGRVGDEREIEDLAEAARAVEGVKGVKNLLHTPPAAGEAGPAVA
jgi:osmotically-inducible protein OsmY